MMSQWRGASSSDPPHYPPSRCSKSSERQPHQAVSLSCTSMPCKSDPNGRVQVACSSPGDLTLSKRTQKSAFPYVTLGLKFE
jgi:hypothetical protein